MEKKISQEAKVAADWWATQLRKGATMNSVNQEERLLNPGATRSQELADFLGQLNARKHQNLSDEGIDKFESFLASAIQEFFVETWDESEPNRGSALRTLHVDYAADDMLSATYQAAGGQIHVNVFPIKTTMWVNPGTVRVRCGYGSNEVELMPSQERKR